MRTKGLYILIAIATLVASCTKDHIIGGEQEDINAYKNTPTFDVLKTDAVYDTLVQLIEAAGLQNEVNTSNTTFFAPTDYAVMNYLNDRTLYVQSVYGDTKKFGLDSLIYYLKNNINNTKDSFRLYIVKPALNYGDLTASGQFYETGLSAKKVIVSYEYVRSGDLGYNPIVSSIPRVVYLSYLYQPYDLSDSNPASDIPSVVGVRSLCKVSGLRTQNGIMNELEASHVLFFSNWRGNISQ
ncbi:fasciclin domain-containing protein [Niabella drilacis]|uniref:Fasciclin domain-containing protein n=1 Tax=Niabella drilacis (strain DSM 25811 / CCM 8410 / CCUG 62505 / LMG 26954 / E90) TaxID=1285928 RepID=A0A1G6LSV4_NIADE|nr:fasciclin domain-containing protein [Niabella drilacis]SDC46342.1 Fasciclin domain-containing protein [Niabella drilacis]